jgi:7-cyano-7-deazaguanine synthase
VIKGFPLYPATVLLSGGQDSTTSLFWALRQFREVDAVCINYGQKHISELDAAHHVAEIAQVALYRYHLPTLTAVSDSALVDSTKKISVISEHNRLPASFTPGRNDLFLTVAAIHAYKYRRTGPIHLVAGVCQTDYSGYPDCRQQFIDAKATSLSLALEREVKIHTPLMWLTKAETVKLALSFDDPAVWLAMRYTITCYEGLRPGCGECPACRLRLKGFEEAGIPDPSIYADTL